MIQTLPYHKLKHDQKYWGYPSQLFEVAPSIFEENEQNQYRGFVPLHICQECEKPRAHELDDYICIQCRHPKSLTRNGKYIHKPWDKAPDVKDNLRGADLVEGADERLCACGCGKPLTRV